MWEQIRANKRKSKLLVLVMALLLLLLGFVLGAALFAQGVTVEGADLGLLTLPEERSVMRKLLYFPDVLETVARKREPHHIPMYLLDLANIFHNYYQAHRVVTDDKPLSKARLALRKAVGSVVGKGLNLLGVEAVERM